MCRVRTPLTRRAVLRGGLVAAAGTVALPAIAACDRGPTPEQVTAAALLPMADAALADQLAAQQLSPQEPEYSAALTVIATQRGDHARALREEITRLDQRTADRIATPGSASGTASATPSADASAAPPVTSPTPTTVSGLRAALGVSARNAGDAAVSLSGYPAGLAGSISASVTTMVEVQLA
ncbi:hypothetical protein ACWDTI_17360 [Gordonia sp. NPDC003424]